MPNVRYHVGMPEEDFEPFAENTNDAETPQEEWIRTLTQMSCFRDGVWLIHYGVDATEDKDPPCESLEWARVERPRIASEYGVPLEKLLIKRTLSSLSRVGPAVINILENLLT